MLNKLKLAIGIAQLRKKRKRYRKFPIHGERMHLKCQLADPVEYLLYRPRSDRKDLPLFIELHGGAWVANDAVLVDSLCLKIAEEGPAVVVNLNYKKLDVHPFPYPQEELCAIISHFIENASFYSINPEKVVICGQSAGAHIAASAALMAKDQGLAIRHQILIYPFVDFTGSLPSPFPDQDSKARDYMKLVRGMLFRNMAPDHPYVSPLITPSDRMKSLSPATIVVCGKDSLRPHGIEYDQKLKQSGIASELVDYPLAEHGFLEVNRPDYVDPHPAKSHEQESYSHDCENRIIQILQSL